MGAEKDQTKRVSELQKPELEQERQNQMNIVTIEEQAVIRVASGDYCSVSIQKSGKIIIGSITLTKDELAEFLQAIPQAVEKCGKPETQP